MKAIKIDLSKCVGCMNCQYACSFMQMGDFKDTDANIRVNYYSGSNATIALTCLHCESPNCKMVCPSNAIVRDSVSNAVIIRADRCRGCKLCIQACPNGAIHFNTILKVSAKCDLCDGDPYCVKHCISGALTFEDIHDDMNSSGSLRELLK